WGQGQAVQGAPVDAEGNPIYHAVPKSWDAAETDGERWRWCLEQAVEVNAGLLNQSRMELANFLFNQFGEQTLANYGWWFWGGGRDGGDDDAEKREGSILTLD